MNLVAERKAIVAALDAYRTELDRVTDDQFAQTPPDGGWSIAEVYSHILQATLGSSIAAERCARGTAPATSKGLTLLGRFFMLAGRFPPFKVKVPPTLAAAMPVSKITKEEARNMLIKCHRRVETIMPIIPEAHERHRANHPRFGMLNAAQWLKFMRVHLEHHLKQVKRVEKTVGN